MSSHEKDFAEFIISLLVVVIVIGKAMLTPDEHSFSKCAKRDCDYSSATGSIYCVMHGGWTSSGDSTKKNSSSDEKCSSSSGSKPGSYKKDSYDKGYDDVYFDDDYDWDRYMRDDDYASGADDAMEDLDW